MRKPYLLFDAGGTLAWPDFYYLSLEANNFGVHVEPQRLFQVHCRMILDLDLRTQDLGQLADPFPNGYPHTLFKGLVHDPAVLKALVTAIEDRNKDKSLWTSTHPWVKDTLGKLRSSGYPMSVISNSDGRVDQILDELGLKSFFDHIFDSHILGISKPDGLIFQTALEKLGLQPRNSIYIGDVYYIDVWGANQAGIGCIHLDPEGLYTNWPGVHLPTIAHLPDWLAGFQPHEANASIFPAIDLAITF